MKNPSSFEHIKTIYSFDATTKNPYMFIRCIFNGSNSFGGVVEHMVSAKVDEKQKRYMILEWKNSLFKLSHNGTV